MSSNFLWDIANGFRRGVISTNFILMKYTVSFAHLERPDWMVPLYQESGILCYQVFPRNTKSVSCTLRIYVYLRWSYLQKVVAFVSSLFLLCNIGLHCIIRLVYLSSSSLSRHKPPSSILKPQFWMWNRLLLIFFLFLHYEYDA